MRKIYLLLFVAALMLSLVACKSETVTLRCDGESCQNIVEVKIGKDTTPDDSWIIFCQDCADKVLAD